jgi:hypothetical protein
MKPLERLWLAAAVLAFFAAFGLSQEREKQEPVRMPNGKLQQEEILKAEHERNLKDAALLMQMSEEIKIELEKNERHVLSLATLKKLDEIEKVARRMRSRMRNH